MADSRPLPGPCTRTWTRLTPSPIASRAHCSAATVAANGVLFFEPLKPAFPDEPHATALPWLSVMVTVVLLKVALMCAIPSASTTRFAFFPVAMCVCHSERSEESAFSRRGDEKQILRCCAPQDDEVALGATSSPSFYQRSRDADPSSCAHSYASADPVRVAPDDGECHDTIRCPSNV